VAHALFVVAARGVGRRVDRLQRFLVALLALVALRVQLESLFKRIHRLVILFHQVMACSLACPGLDKVRVHLDRFLGVLKSGDWLHKFDVSCGSVRVNSFVIGISSEAFFEFRDCAGEVSVLEFLVARVLVLIGELGVEVRLPLSLTLEFLAALKSILNVNIVMLD